MVCVEVSLTLKWVGKDPPSISTWRSLISEMVTLEKIGHCINGRLHFFLQKWKKPLELLGVKYSLNLNG